MVAREPTDAPPNEDATRISGVVRIAAPAPTASPLLGASVCMNTLREQLALVARRSAPVLIIGERGTGKDLVAAELHRQSGAKGAFHVLSCTASSHLVDSDLFGHRRGAFTGALESRAGALESAADGTLLLDEVDKLPLATQAALLRAVEGRRFRRVGEDAERSFTGRVAAATNAVLPALVSEGRFLPDLFDRLDALVIPVPALRAHPEDIPVLLGAFLSAMDPPCSAELAPEAWAALAEHTWPGNVRELRNVAERIATYPSRGATWTADEVRGLLRSDARAATPPVVPALSAVAALDAEQIAELVCRLPGRLKDNLAAIERHAMSKTLARCGGSVRKAAKAAGMNRARIQRGR